MFTDKQLHRYADVLLWGLKTARAGKIKKNEIILVRYDLAAIKLVEIVYQKLIEAGLNPVHRLLQTPDMEKKFYFLSSPKQLSFIPPGEEELYKHLNGTIAILAPESLTHLSGIDPSKIAKSLISRKPFRTILDEREEKGLFSWTLCMFPTRELATHAGMSIEEYSRQIAGACFLNRTDPISQWESVFKQAQSIKQWLNRMDVKKFHVTSDHIDLEITPGEQRKWIGISGHNIPSFELFISPDWRGTPG
nr:aminopeptidase [Desulfobacteraceae bacterium]